MLLAKNNEEEGGGRKEEEKELLLTRDCWNGIGRTRLERLLLIGVCSSALGVEALKLAVREAKQGKDIKRYLEAQNHLETIGPDESEAQRDLSWMERTERQNQAESQRLEAELKGYKNNLIKESIRVCFALLYLYLYF